MSRIEVFNCQSALATIPTPPQAFMCCGFCCDFPLFFVGTVGLVGPLFNTPENLAFCEANYSYAPTYMILWRVNPCPEVAYAGIPYGPELRVAQGLNGSIYPICEGTDLSGADFTTVWKIGNPISVTGSCSKTDGNIVFNMSGTFRKELCVMYFDITGWGGFADQDCAKEGTAPYWCVLDSDTNTYSCICSWYLPPGAISGPHITLSDCNTACSTSSQAPWWCVTGTCSQSALNPCAPPAACDVPTTRPARRAAARQVGPVLFFRFHCDYPGGHGRRLPGVCGAVGPPEFHELSRRPAQLRDGAHAGTHRRGVPPPLGGPARAPRRPIEDYSVEFIAKKNRILIGKA